MRRACAAFMEIKIESDVLGLGAMTKGLSKPLHKLLEIFDSTFLETGRSERQSAAQRRDLLREAVTNEDILDIHDIRALDRVLKVERRRQENLAAIGRIAAEQLRALPAPDSESDAPVSPDWVAMFFEHAQDVGDAEMRILWAKILAGEVAKPGSFSARTMSALRLLTPQEARAFDRLCRFAWLSSGRDWFIFKPTYGSFDDLGVDFDFDDYILAMDSGLVLSAEVAAVYSPGQVYRMVYKESAHDFEVKVRQNVDFPILPLTNFGKELAPLSDSPRVETYYDWCLSMFATQGFQFAAQPAATTQPAPAGSEPTSSQPPP